MMQHVVYRTSILTQNLCRRQDLFSRGSFSRPLPPPGIPGLSVLSDQADESLHLGLGDVFLQQFAVVVQQSGDGVLSQDVVTDLTLHHTELIGDVLLENNENINL